MKQVLLIISAILTMVCTTNCAPKCIYINDKDMLNDNKSLACETMKIEKTDNELGTKFSFVVDFPIQGDNKLTTEIKRNIFEIMGDTVQTVFSKDNMLKIADNFVKDSYEEVKDIKESMGGDFAAAYDFIGEIRLKENTSRYVSYYFDMYIYTGGAHGLPAKGYFTIDKETCKVITLKDLIIPGKEEELKQLIKSYIVGQYYEGKAPEWGDFFSFALPSLDPGITSNGVVFYYGSYEIDCYAAGLPHCTIPFEKMKDILSDRVKGLIL